MKNTVAPESFRLQGQTLWVQCSGHDLQRYIKHNRVNVFRSLANVGQPSRYEVGYFFQKNRKISWEKTSITNLVSGPTASVEERGISFKNKLLLLIRKRSNSLKILAFRSHVRASANRIRVILRGFILHSGVVRSRANGHCAHVGRLYAVRGRTCTYSGNRFPFRVFAGALSTKLVPIRIPI